VSGGASKSPWKDAKKARRALRCELVEARDTNRGRGLFALAAFAPGELVCGMNEDDRLVQPGGDPEAELAVEMYHAAGPNGTHVLPNTERVGWHLANHSCRPNARLATEHGEGLRARLPIAAGDEITVYYGWTLKMEPCLCGEPACYGWIGLPRRTREGTKGYYDSEDLRGLIRNAVANDNPAAFRTAQRAARLRLKWSPEHFDKLAREVLGPDVEAIVARLDRTSPTKYR
jgi:hypothetical protein